MFNPATVLATAFAEHLVDSYRAVFGKRDPDYGSTIRAMAQLAVERISSSDALYHDAHHTMLVTLAGQTILRGRIMVEEIGPADWLHFTVATLCHDIGYLRGICPGDVEGRYVTDSKGNMIDAPRGASDAFLAPYHIERGKIFVRHRCRNLAYLDPERIAPGDRAHPLPDPRRLRSCRDRHRGGAGPCGRPDRAAGRSGPCAQAQCTLLRVCRDRARAPARLRARQPIWRSSFRVSSGRRSSPISTRRCATWSGPSRASSGSPSFTPTSSSRSMAAAGWGRPAARTKPDLRVRPPA